MLGMPVVTREAGFFPSVFIFILSWAFMTTSALVLLEVSLWFPTETNIAEMTRTYLGKSSEWITFGLMIFLMYALMTAYSSASGTLINEFSNGSISASYGSILFGLILIGLLVIGTKALDWFNRLFMGGLVLSYIALVIVGVPGIEKNNLLHQNWNMSFIALPIAIVSFGFQNLIPSLVNYLNRDLIKIRKSIIIGSLIPLIIYLIWEAIILGLIDQNIIGLEGVQMATTLLERSTNGERSVLFFAQAFAFFAITTSFFANALSIQDFLSDQMKGSLTGLSRYRKRFMVACLTVFPPLFFAYFNPNIFLNALSVAGGFAATILFGLIPALICMRGRQTEKGKHWKVSGGKGLLWVLTVFSVIILWIS